MPVLASPAVRGIAATNRLTAAERHPAVAGDPAALLQGGTALALGLTAAGLDCGCAGDLVVVSPDVGGVARARAFAKKLNDAPLAIVDKRRSAHNVSEVMNLIGDVDGKVAVLVDDMIDTAGDPFAALQSACEMRAGRGRLCNCSLLWAVEGGSLGWEGQAQGLGGCVELMCRRMEGFEAAGLAGPVSSP